MHRYVEKHAMWSHSITLFSSLVFSIFSQEHNHAELCDGHDEVFLGVTQILIQLLTVGKILRGSVSSIVE